MDSKEAKGGGRHIRRLARQLCPRAVADALRWHVADRVAVYEVIQRAIYGIGAQTYLEIGVRWGDTFCRIDCPLKIGVDPIAPAESVQKEIASGRARYYQMPSDEFFSAHDSRDVALDVVFVDGLHTYEQALRDVENALDRLTPGGIIFLHDCSPKTEARAWPAQSYREAEAANVPGWDGSWNGDVWKTVVHLRATRPDLHVCVLNCDHGLGVVTRARRIPNGSLGLSIHEIRCMPFKEFDRNRRGLLNLCAPSSIARVISAQRGIRARPIQS